MYSDCSFPCPPPDPQHWPRPLTLKSMQRAASSDTISTMAFSNADAQSHNSAALRDVKQQLSHSHSMILPENGKVPASGAQTVCTVFTDMKEEMQTHFNTFHTKHWTCAHTHTQTNEHHWCHPLTVFQLVQQCRDYSCNVTNIVMEPPSPDSSPDSDGCTPVRKHCLLLLKLVFYWFDFFYCLETYNSFVHKMPFSLHAFLTNSIKAFEMFGILHSKSFYKNNYTFTIFN